MAEGAAAAKGAEHSPLLALLSNLIIFTIKTINYVAHGRSKKNHLKSSQFPRPQSTGNITSNQQFKKLEAANVSGQAAMVALCTCINMPGCLGARQPLMSH